MQKKIFSIGFGVGTQNRKGEWLEVFYPKPLLNPSSQLVKSIVSILNYKGGNQVIKLTILQAAELAHKIKLLDEKQAAILVRLAESDKPIVAVILAEDIAPQTTAEAYLKLHLISHRLITPKQINLLNICDVLPVVAWTNHGAIDLTELAEYQLEHRLKNRMLKVNSIDRLPPMTDYVVPSGIRINDASKVLLGSYLVDGTIITSDALYDFNTST